MCIATRARVLTAYYPQGIRFIRVQNSTARNRAPSHLERRQELEPYEPPAWWALRRAPQRSGHVYLRAFISVGQLFTSVSGFDVVSSGTMNMNR